MNNNIIISDTDYDIEQYNKDKLLAINILKKEIYKSKLNNIKYSEFIEKFRPIGNNGIIRKYWDELDHHIEDDWVILLYDDY